MPGLTAQVRFPHISGLVEDTVINTLHFGGDPATADFVAILAAIENFYSNGGFPGMTRSLTSYMSPAIDRAAPTEVRIYDTSTTANSGPPLFTGTFTIGLSGSTQGLPSEVASVLSFYSGAASNVATGRGRIYFGPLNALAMQVSAEGYPEVNAVFQADAVAVMEYLEDATPVNPWSVRTVDLGVVGFNDVDGGFVDNAFDTQRRRGEVPARRTSWHV